MSTTRDRPGPTRGPIPEQERGFYPPELSLRLFTQDQAKEVVYRLVEEAGLSVEQKVVDNLIEAATVAGDVSPVDLGIGLLILAELHGRQAGRTVTIRDSHFVGGAEGLLTEYIRNRLEIFPAADRDELLKALLALHDPQTNQRIAAGRTDSELAQAAGIPEGRSRPMLDRLTQRDVRLLEVVEVEENADPHCRRPHERLIPALRRLTGRLLAEVAQARLKFEEAFLAETELPQEESPSPNGTRAVVAAVVVGLSTAGRLGKQRIDRAEGQAHLNDHGYPPGV